MPVAQEIRIPIPDADTAEVSGLLLVPERASACYVFAHGAGAGMRHAFMASVAEGLAARGIATLRYQFPAMETGARRPDRPPVAHAAVRAAVAAAHRHVGPLRCFAGGKSFGGRMTSQAQAIEPLPGVEGLVFLSYPLHPAGRPAVDRAAHLRDVDLPMLFVHGTQDALAEPAMFRAGIGGLGLQATTVEIDDADHALHVPRRSGRTDIDVLDDALDAIAVWAQAWQL